jgi:hypothetical protein
MRRTGTVGAALAWLVTGCAGVSTSIDWNESYVFSDLGTFDWIERDAPSGIDVRTVGEIVGTADTVLLRKGYSKDADSPSFLVAYHFGQEEQYSSRRYSNPFDRETYLEASKQSRLIIDLIDPETNEAVWSGSAGIEADPSDVHKNAPLIRNAVRELLAGFPPEEDAP